jgi:hypothetical protein
MFEIVMGIDDFLIQLVKYCIGNKSLNLLLMAGHANNFRKIDEGRKIAKRTNQKEYEIYANPGGLRDIIPAAERTNQDYQEQYFTNWIRYSSNSILIL